MDQPADLFQHTCRKECDDRDKGDHAHITDNLVDRMFNAPQGNGDKTDEYHPILLESERIPGRAYGSDFNISLTVGRTGRAVRCEEEQPDKDNRNSRHREGDNKPSRPAYLRIHGG